MTNLSTKIEQATAIGRRSVEWFASWLLYLAGDLVCRWNDNDRRFTQIVYRLYQWLMLKSADVQGGGRGPWQLMPPSKQGTQRHDNERD